MLVEEIVPEGDMAADRKAGIKWVDDPDWKKLHDMDPKMVKDFLDHKRAGVDERMLSTSQKLAQMQHYWDNLSHLAPNETKKKNMNMRFGIFNIKLDGNKILSFDCCRHGYAEGKSPHKKGTKKYKAHMAAIHAGESVAAIQTEKLGPNSDAGEYVKDFQKSDAPQFKGKSKKKKHQMAIAAFCDAKPGNCGPKK